MSENLTVEAIEKAVKKLDDFKSVQAPVETGEWKPMFEFAEDGEIPKEIWIPNRKERRLMKKYGNKAEKAAAKFYQSAIDSAKGFVNTPNYKNEIYKALYEKVKTRNEELDKEIEKNGISAVEGN